MALKDRSLVRRGHVAADGVCRVLLELAVDHFAERGKDELIEWQFGTSRQLGEYIFSLAQEGGFVLSDADAVDQFDGWYDLQTDPSTWKLQW